MESRLRSISTPHYDIHIGNEAPDLLNSFLKKNHFSKIFILVDENTLQHCLPLLVSRVKKLAGAELIELESGEQNKNLDVCTQVWRVLGELGADRHALLINLGGGVICDLGGFVASTFKRGIAFINIPTTLLAQVDASVGGKTGVDLDGLKNEVGVFSNPKALYICPSFLKTLLKREMLSGFAEMLKHGLIADKKYFEKLEHLNIAADHDLAEMIFESVKIKFAIVDSDPLEKDKRKALNFGHTVGHALETFFLERGEATLLHGEAVAAGMICEAWLSNRQGSLPGNELNKITEVLLHLYGTVALDNMADHRLLELMKHDKKNTDQHISFTLLPAIGESVTDKKLSAAQIIEALEYYRSCEKHADAN